MNEQLITTIAASAVTAVYAIGRSYTKAQGEGGKPGWKTSEFWLVVLGWAVKILETVAK